MRIATLLLVPFLALGAPALAQEGDEPNALTPTRRDCALGIRAQTKQEQPAPVVGQVLANAPTQAQLAAQ